MIASVIVDNRVQNNIVIAIEDHIPMLEQALNAEIIDAEPLGLAIGDYRVDGAWYRDLHIDDGETTYIETITLPQESEAQED